MGMIVDVSNVESNIQEFANGIYEAKVVAAKYDVSKSSNDTMIVLQIEIYHPSYGSAKLRDWLPPSFPAKCLNFFMALNDYSREDVAEMVEVEIPEPQELVGAEILIQLGEQENKQTGKVYKSIVGPWYYPLSRAGELLGGDEDPFSGDTDE